MKSLNAPKIDEKEHLSWKLNHPREWENVLTKARQETEYLPWRKVRYMEAPPEMSKEIWWTLLQEARNLKPINPLLKGQHGTPFLLANIPQIQQMLHQIDKCAGFAVTTEHPLPDFNAMRRMYLQQSQVLEAISSSQLEGAATTRQVAKQMLTENRPPRDNSERMIFNNYNTITQLNEWKNEPLSEALLFKIHQALTADLLETSKQGRYRTAEDNVVVANTHGETVYIPPPAHSLPKRIDNLIQFANAQHSGTNFLHPVLKGILLHTILAYEHPFYDGNGRTARALFYWCLLREGYWLTPYISISKELHSDNNYHKAYLDMEHCALDTTYCILVNLKAFLRGIEKFQSYVQPASNHMRQVKEKFGKQFNRRQIALLEHTLRHTSYHYTVEEHRRWHDIVLNTARSDLMDLVAKGYLKKHTYGRKTTFADTGLFTSLSASN